MIEFTASTPVESFMQPKDVLELGRAIVRELEIDARGEVLSRWMAHHVAELIEKAEISEGVEKDEAEKRAVELILKLWVNRRALPTPADPMSGYADAIKVLGAMLPTSNPWRGLKRISSADDLLYDMFGALAAIVMSGLLLTRPVEMRRIDEVEWSALSDEEKFLSDLLARWQGFLKPKMPVGSDIEALLASLEALHAEPNVVAQAPILKPSHDDDPDAQRREILATVQMFQERLGELLKRLSSSVDTDAGDEDCEEDEESNDS